MFTIFRTFDFERTCCRLFQKRVMLTTFQTFVWLWAYQLQVILDTLYAHYYPYLKIKGLESSEHNACLE
jgi:hypothetical protein